MLEYLNYATPEVPNPLRDPWLLMYVTPKGRTDGWEDHVRSLVPEEKTVDARRIRSHPDDYILCFSYYDLQTFWILMFIKVPTFTLPVNLSTRRWQWITKK